jgi:hypothetical protein
LETADEDKKIAEVTPRKLKSMRVLLVKQTKYFPPSLSRNRTVKSSKFFLQELTQLQKSKVGQLQVPGRVPEGTFLQRQPCGSATQVSFCARPFLPGPSPIHQSNEGNYM